MKNKYYLKKNTGFLIKQGEDFIPTCIHQPTPEGVAELCNHYSRKYSIDLRCVDLREYADAGDNIFPFFQHLKENPTIIHTEEGRFTGLILSHGQHHVVPVLLAKTNGIQSMVIFDSNSGGRIKGYFRIANLFPEFQFYLNNGTRQADEGSCMTDAICVLKEALMIPDIVALVHSKKITEHQDFEPGRFFKMIPKPDHFNLFRMPERLLLTAQRSKYLVQADADVNVVLRGGKSLKAYRDDFLLSVMQDGEYICINGYLYQKSEEHRRILDALTKTCSAQTASFDEMDMITGGLSPYPVTAKKGIIAQSPYGFSLM